MSKRKPRRFTPQQKAVTVTRHQLEKVPVSNLCDELELQPSVFYAWQQQLFSQRQR